VVWWAGGLMLILMTACSEKIVKGPNHYGVIFKKQKQLPDFLKESNRYSFWKLKKEDVEKAEKKSLKLPI